MIDRRAFISSCVALVVAPHLPLAVGGSPAMVDPESLLWHMLRDWHATYGYVPRPGTTERLFLECWAAQLEQLMDELVYGDPRTPAPKGLLRA